MNKEYTLIRTWRKNGFSLRLYDTHKRSEDKRQLAYEFRYNRKMIDFGDDYFIPSCWDKNELFVVYECLSYFASEDNPEVYYPVDELSMIVYDWEEKHNRL